MMFEAIFILFLVSFLALISIVLAMLLAHVVYTDNKICNRVKLCHLQVLHLALTWYTYRWYNRHLNLLARI